MVINDHDFCDNHNADHVGDCDTNHDANHDADHDDNHDHYYSRVGNDNGDHIGNVANAHKYRIVNHFTKTITTVKSHYQALTEQKQHTSHI